MTVVVALVVALVAVLVEVLFDNGDCLYTSHIESSPRLKKKKIFYTRHDLELRLICIYKRWLRTSKTVSQR